MWRSVRVAERPSGDLIELEVLKQWLSIEHDDDDLLLAQMLKGAVSLIDGPDGIGIAMMRQIWARSLDRFEPVIFLAGWPVKAIEKIEYIDVYGDQQVLSPSDYRLDAHKEPARLAPAIGKAWPATAPISGAVDIHYAVGEAVSDDVPPTLIEAVCMMVLRRYEHRGAISPDEQHELPHAVDCILNNYRRCHAAG